MFKKVAGWHNHLVVIATGARIICLMQAAMGDIVAVAVPISPCRC
jgi:hypothetical protein